MCRKAWRFVVAGLIAFSNLTLGAQSSPIRHEVKSDGHPLALWEKRPATPKGVIVLLHGRTWSSLPDFDLQVPGEKRSLMDALVARGYAVYALDLRGYGGSPRDPSGWNTPDQAASDLANAIRWVSANSGVATKPVLFGWSNGSTVAQLMAQQHPELISDLILFGYWKDPAFKIPAMSDTVSLLREKTTAAKAAEDFVAPNVISKKAIEIYVQAALKADPVRTDWRQLDEFNALDARKVTVPTLLIQGELDPLAPTASQARLFANLANPDRAWVIIAGGDHAALLEETQPAFVAAMVNFIERPRLKY
jgi:pimeloyl-ACP methyl ester carboxylesterase